MTRFVRRASVAAAGRGVRFSSAPSDNRFLLPTMPSGDSVQQSVFVHGGLAKNHTIWKTFGQSLKKVGQRWKQVMMHIFREKFVFLLGICFLMFTLQHAPTCVLAVYKNLGKESIYVVLGHPGPRPLAPAPGR
ncbi:hypothetical protein MTO96_050541, partial [Rhipicephalus appendiculatus]